MIMKTNIFVPKKINVGFQNRKDTYTGKLAYVIYYDQKGKLRKEASWNSWRNQGIPNEVYDNEPMEGFVLNKKVGGVEESWGWDVRKTYTRIYDPRGFEFEITVPNLLWILENCDCIKGKGLEGQFVYGWDGTELVLVPVESPDYKEIVKKNDIIHNNEFIKAKDLVIGATYETLKGERYVYMGKYDEYKLMYNYYYGEVYTWSRHKTVGWEFPLDDTWMDDTVNGNKDRRYKFVNLGKKFWFICLGYSWKTDYVCTFGSVSRKFSNLVTTECEKYPEYYEMMEESCSFSPINFSENKILPTSYAVFHNEISEKMLKEEHCIPIHHLDNTKSRLVITNLYRDWKSGKYYYEESNGYGYGYGQKKYMDMIDDIYNQFKPMYGEQYLENGKLYLRRGYYGS